MAQKLPTESERIFNDVYSLYWHELYSYAYNIMRDKAVSEDIIQEIFIDFWKRMDRIEIQNYRAYLYKAVKFQCATKLKSQRFHEIQLDKIEFALTLLEENDFSSEEFRQNLLQRIESKAVEILPARCLQVFQLRYYENKSYLEIAQQMNISVSTVENQLNKALKMLRAEDLIVVLAILNTEPLIHSLM